MSNVFGNLGKKITSTLENAQKDLRQSFAKSLSVAAQTIAQPPLSDRNRSAGRGGTKSQLFATILERASRVKSQLQHASATIAATQGNNGDGSSLTASSSAVAAATIATSTEPNEGASYEAPMALLKRLEKEFGDLVEAYELLLSERCHLEEILTCSSQLESLDDLELVGQYYRSLHDTAQLSKQEISRLTEENKQLRERPSEGDETSSVAMHENRVIPPVHEPPIEISGAMELYPPTNVASIKELDQEEKEEEGLQTSTSSPSDIALSAVAAAEQRWEQERKLLVAKISEQTKLIDALETQKLAFETKVSFLQSQTLEMDGLRTKIRELSSTGSAEIDGLKKTAEVLQNKLETTEENLKNLRQQLQSTQAELQYLRQDRERDLEKFSHESLQHREIVLANSQKLKAEQQQSSFLQEEIATIKKECDELRKKLFDRNSEILILKRKAPVEVLSPNEKTTPSGLSLGEGSIGPSSSTVDIQATNVSATSLRSLKSECERLARENNRLKANSQIEHMRNIVLRYLQLPDQRNMLLPVIVSLFKLTPEEISTIRK